MRKMSLALMMILGLTVSSNATSVTDGPCANPFFKNQALIALNKKNDEMKNLVVFLTMADVRDIWHNDSDYVACRVSILDNQGLTYNGVLKWSLTAGFMFTPDTQQETD